VSAPRTSRSTSVNHGTVALHMCSTVQFLLNCNERQRLVASSLPADPRQPPRVANGHTLHTACESSSMNNLVNLLDDSSPPTPARPDRPEVAPPRESTSSWSRENRGSIMNPSALLPRSCLANDKSGDAPSFSVGHALPWTMVNPREGHRPHNKLAATN
jgi:hypothetical protein